MSDAVERLAATKTLEELQKMEASLTGSLAVAPPGEYYGRLFTGITMVKQAIDKKQKEGGGGN